MDPEEAACKERKPRAIDYCFFLINLFHCFLLLAVRPKNQQHNRELWTE
jgi:hypothetical protein